ncbi:universal stress protein [Aquabacterium sp. A7-Y]|uniref:universal stress protein n=1 Tax=Aquabacterium sp. A7-Y TaxID=1349605 RepID=UPI00223CD5CC|nr:universal stress protein [Aquabacterium sp. A7-Y]MCW7541127.1 universal stress protein [Aquabacterium sp. A7-Y]
MYQRMLLPFDGSPAAERGLREAIALAVDQHAALRIVHIIDLHPLLMGATSSVSYEGLQRTMREYGQAMVNKAARTASEAGIAVETALREATPGERTAEAILAEAADSGCDLMVMGTHGRRGLSRWMLGSDAELVARSSPIPVLLVKPPDAAALHQAHP